MSLLQLHRLLDLKALFNQSQEDLAIDTTVAPDGSARIIRDYNHIFKHQS
ncbi:hypothetical protein [Chamaesiphon minutus]|nr:hypothetical protein [Chamaesiphon minutus]